MRKHIKTAKESQRKQSAGHGLGRTGERLAAEELVRRGYQILARNFSCRYGEVDIIAEHGPDVVFVEVKTRRGDAYGLPEEAVTLRKQQKLIQTATIFLDQKSWGERSWRIDVVAVQMSRSGQLQEIRVHEYAVTES